VRTFTRQMASDAGYRDARVRGVQVASVQPGSVSERTGLKPGDIILEVSGKPVASAKAFVDLMAKGEISAGTPLGVVRGNRLGNLALSR